MLKVPLFILLFCNGLANRMALSETSAVSQKKIIIVGGGPVGLYFAALMLHKDPSVKIEILEKESTPSVNAFGLGVGSRMQHRLSDVPGLKERAISISANVEYLNIPLVSRNDLTEQMGRFLLENTNCKLTNGEECESIDLGRREITTRSGRRIQYDLILAADGVNSPIRRQLVEQKGFQEEHYLYDNSWKALKLPKQPELNADSFKPFRHPSVLGGRVLPSAPEGHILLMFWKSNGSQNPTGIRTVQDLKLMVTEAMQDKFRKKNSIRNMLGMEMASKIVKKDRKIVYDEAALEQFVNARAGRTHHLQMPQYHYQDSVALIGDSAHSFNSLLGQGCATGFESSCTLVNSLTSSANLSDALSNYSQVASAEAHAISECSLISFAMSAGILMKLKMAPLIIWSMMCGTSLIKQIRDITIPFSQIMKDNTRILKLCRREFEKQRLPFEDYSKTRSSPAVNSP